MLRAYGPRPTILHDEDSKLKEPVFDVDAALREAELTVRDNDASDH